jgi:hypothetical protein
MQSVRLAPPGSVVVSIPCSRCDARQRPWDRIAGKAYCPSCQEGLALGEGEPLIARADKRLCAACSYQGTVCLVTMPLNSRRPVELDVCGHHLRELLGRRLGPHAFHQLRRQLAMLGVDASEIFLLHDGFYDEQGRALQPTTDVE